MMENQSSVLEERDKRIAALDAEVERLRTALTDNWEHSWKCKHKEERERLGLPIDKCICGLPEALLSGEEAEE